MSLSKLRELVMDREAWCATVRGSQRVAHNFATELKGNQPWIFIGRTDAESPILWPPDAKSLLWKRPWCWERLKAWEGDDRGWAGWMASATGWTWVWASSRSWWWTGKPGVLQSMGSQRVGHDWETELNWYKALSTASGTHVSINGSSHGLLISFHLHSNPAR